MKAFESIMVSNLFRLVSRQAIKWPVYTNVTVSSVWKREAGYAPAHIDLIKFFDDEYIGRYCPTLSLA